MAQNNAVDENTTIGNHHCRACFVTNMTINAMIASSMFALEITIGTLPILTPYVNHIKVPDRPMRCESPETPSTLLRAYTRTTCGQMNTTARNAATAPEIFAKVTEQQ